MGVQHQHLHTQRCCLGTRYSHPREGLLHLCATPGCLKQQPDRAGGSCSCISSFPVCGGCAPTSQGMSRTRCTAWLPHATASTKCARLPSQPGRAHSACASPFGLASEAAWDEQGHCFLCCLKLPPALLSSWGDRGALLAAPWCPGKPRLPGVVLFSVPSAVFCGTLWGCSGLALLPAGLFALRAPSRPRPSSSSSGSAASPHSG